MRKHPNLIVITTLILLFGPINLIAQNKYQPIIDSLQKEVKNASNNKVKADFMIELGVYQFVLDENKGSKTILSAVDLYKKNDVVSRSIAYSRLATSYNSISDISQTRMYFLKSAELVKNNSSYDSLEANYLMNVGRTFYQEAKYDSAMVFYMKAKDIFESGKIYNEHHGHLYHYIGSVHKRQDDMDKACSWYVDQENYGIKHGLIEVEADAVYLQADCARDANHQVEINERALALFKKMGVQRKIALLQGNLALSYNSAGKYDEAEKSVKSAIEYFERKKNKRFLGVQYANLATILINKGKYDEAKKFLQLSEEIANSYEAKQFIRLSEINKAYYSLYSKENNYKLALDHYKKYKAYDDSAIQVTYKEAVAEMDVKYQTAEKELKISRQDSKIAQQNANQEKESIIKRFLIAGLVLTLILGFAIYNRLKVSVRQKRVIEHQKKDVEAKNKEILDSISYAKRIQAAILPPLKVIKEYLNKSFILYLPKDIVAGDFYWMEHREDIVLFAAADCTGHGVPGAMVSVICNNGLNRSVREEGLTDPGKILDHTRKVVISEFEKSEDDVQDGMDIALCALKGNKLSYAGANNPLWIIRNNGQELIEIKADKQPIGKSENPIDYTTHHFEMESGDTVYLFSDGFADQFGGDESKKYKSAQFKRFLLSIQNSDMQTQKEMILEEFNTWKGEEEQVDDICVIGVRF